MDTLAPQSTPKTPSRRWLSWVGAVLVGISGVAAWELWQWQSDRATAPPTESDRPEEITTVTALGRLEPQGETIQVTASASTQDSRLEELLVEEGDRVEAGEVIAVLDNRDRLQAALRRAEKEVGLAQTKLAQVRAGAKVGEIEAQRAEIARLEADRAGNINTQRAAVARLEAEVENARIEDQRHESLYQQGAISASDRDTKELTYTTAQRQLQEARAALERIQTTSQRQIEQARATLERIAEVRPVDIDAAQAEVEAALAAVEEARANLELAYVRSPLDGQILKIHARPGEKIADEGIVTLGQTQQMVAIAEVYQSDIARIELGQRATMTSPAIAGSLEGTVERIGLQVEQQQVVDEDPAANIDAKVIEVRIRLDPDASQRVAHLSNLQIAATIRTR